MTWMMQLLAQGAILPPYRPFIDPIQVHGKWWLMVIPMAFGVAVVYKAVRIRNLSGSGYWLGVLKMMVEIIAGMALLGVLSYGVVMVYARWVAGG
jgi:hypothetical protein